MSLRPLLVLASLPLISLALRVAAEERAGPFDARLLEIAREYPRYGRVDDETRWAPQLCRMPNPSTARFSQSDDAATHGEKLYFLFARNRADYLKFTEKSAPASQVVVKEAWKAKEAAEGETAKPVRELPQSRDEIKFPPDDNGKGSAWGTYLPYAKKDGKLYKAHEKAGLYIMFQLDAKTADTDAGWVYGTVTADGRSVTSAGRVESCMKCHQDAPNGRLFGLAAKK